MPHGREIAAPRPLEMPMFSSSRRLAAVALTLVSVAAGPATPAVAALPGFQSTQSPSMQPTIRQGDRFLVDNGYYASNRPSRGDVAVYQHPRRHHLFYIKRIVALAGDRIAIVRGHVILNGVAVDEPYAVPGDPHAFHANMAEITVPGGFVFVLGDNRAMSSDSRAVATHGLVPVENLRARATYIVWSNDLTRIGSWIGTH
jgi:signal peptidase I